MIKKLFAAFIVMIMIVTVSACGLGGHSSNHQTGTKSSVASENKHNNEGKTMEPAKKNGPVAKAVDLGLSVKWASFNLGASKPEAYGGSYGWADSTGKKTSTSNNDYPSENPPKHISGTKYDIAHTSWGGSWRLPTRKEQQELVDKCRWTETELNGVRGYRVTGPNGNSIFLAASGGRIGKEFYYRVEGADFWNGDLGSDTGRAGCMWFYQGQIKVDDLPRYYGFAVRPVSD